MIDELRNLKVGKVIKNPKFTDYTTYKLSGNALALVMPETVEKLIILINYLKENNIKHKIIGNGSNLIFNTYYDGILINLSKFDNLEINKNIITVGAGYSLVKLAMKTAKLGLTGLEFATGIPGTVGGAVFMNAGAYKSDMGYFVKSVKVLTPDYQIKTLTNKELAFKYRTSFLQKNPEYICLEATIVLKKGKIDVIMNLINNRKKRRLDTQPLAYRSAGSVFRNPPNEIAGKIIEELGFKGKKIGDALVSNKHANFIINVGNARGEDIKTLIEDIKKEVEEKKSIELVVEQEFVE